MRKGETNKVQKRKYSGRRERQRQTTACGSTSQAHVTEKFHRITTIIRKANKPPESPPKHIFLHLQLLYFHWQMAVDIVARRFSCLCLHIHCNFGPKTSLYFPIYRTDILRAYSISFGFVIDDAIAVVFSINEFIENVDRWIDRHSSSSHTYFVVGVLGKLRKSTASSIANLSL